jgi:alanyl-tRNA synthetase
MTNKNSTGVLNILLRAFGFRKIALGDDSSEMMAKKEALGMETNTERLIFDPETMEMRRVSVSAEFEERLAKAKSKKEAQAIIDEFSFYAEEPND